MDRDGYANFSVGSVKVAPAPDLTGLTLTLQPGEGDLMPEVPFNAVTKPKNRDARLSNAEIVRVIAKDGDVLTIERAAEGTTAKQIAAGWDFYAGMTAKTLDDIFAELEDLGEARHTHSNKSVLDATTAPFTIPESVKLAGVETGAQVNDVLSVFGRTGPITAESGDYTAAQISSTPAGGLAATSVQAALNELDAEKAPLSSPIFTGNPTAPTASAGSNSTQLATTAFVQTAISNLVSGAPTALDTLQELAAALGNDSNFAATVTNSLAGKQPLDQELTALSSVTSEADKLPYFTGPGAADVADLTVLGRSLIGSASATSARSSLGLGTAALVDDSTLLHRTGAETATGTKSFQSNDTHFGAGVNGGVGGYLTVGNQGTTNTYAEARSTAPTASLNLIAKGAADINLTARGVTGFKDRGGQVFNLRAYGAVGDGVTDDTAAVAAAIAAGNAARGQILVPAGDFLVSSSSLPFSLATGVSVVGTSWASHIKATGTTDQPIFRNTNRVTGGDSGIQFFNLWLEKNPTTGFPNDNPDPAIRMDGAADTVVDRVRFSYGGVQFRPLTTYVSTSTCLTNGNNKHNSVMNCKFDENNIVSIVFSQASHSSAVNNKCHGYDSPIAILGAWDDVLILGNQVYAQSVAGQGIEANQDPGLEAWRDLSIIGNYTKDGHQSGILISGGDSGTFVDGVKIIGNSVVNAGIDGIRVNQNVRGFTISGNTVSGARRAGISLVSDVALIANGSISDNVVLDSGQSGVTPYALYLVTTTTDGAQIANVQLSNNQLSDNQGTPTTTHAIYLQTTSATDAITSVNLNSNQVAGISNELGTAGPGTVTYSREIRSTGAQTLDAVLTFTNSPLVPTPITSSAAANKSYVDTGLATKQPIDPTLTSLAAFNSNGLLVQTSADTFVSRSIIAASGKIIVTNANGVSGNPTIDVSESSISHNSLGDLASGDPHTQYPLLAGRTGGQTLIGGLSSGDSLTLQSTSHTTKGSVLVGTSAYDQVNNRLGLATAVPTHLLTLASSGNGLSIYNTPDQVTNYERGVLAWVSNTLTLLTEKGGTGANRNISISATGTAVLKSGNVSLTVNDASGTTKTTTAWGSTGAGLTMHDYSGTLTSSSAVQRVLALQPTINQSGTGGYTGLLVNPTETATGNGLKLIADLQVGGASKWRVDNTAVVNMANATPPGGTPSAGGYLYVESGALKYKGSGGTVTVLAPA